MTYAAAVCRSDEYQSSLRAAGYDPAQSFEYGGQVYSQEHIAGLFQEAYAARRSEFPLVCGAKPAVERRRQRQYLRACQDDVGRSLGISPATLGFALLLGILGGPLGLLIAVISVLFQHYLEKDLEGNQAFRAALGVTG